MPETKFKYQKGYSKTVINIGKLKNRYIHTPSLGKEVFYSKRLLGRECYCNRRSETLACIRENSLRSINFSKVGRKRAVLL